MWTWGWWGVDVGMTGRGWARVGARQYRLVALQGVISIDLVADFLVLLQVLQ